MDRKLLKSNAKQQLGGGIFKTNWLNGLLVCLIYSLIIGAAGGLITWVSGGASFDPEMLMDTQDFTLVFSFMRGSFVGSGIGLVVTILLAGPLSFGISKIFLDLVMGSDRIEIGDLFSGFKTDFGGTVLIGLMTYIFTFLWTLLFIIPGIVKGIAYSMAYFVKVEHPEYNWRQCINESKRITKGHKGELFILNFSFIGWMIVCCFTLGIGFLWLAPYMECTNANAYAYLTANDNSGFSPEE